MNPGHLLNNNNNKLLDHSLVNTYCMYLRSLPSPDNFLILWNLDLTNHFERPIVCFRQLSQIFWSCLVCTLEPLPVPSSISSTVQCYNFVNSPSATQYRVDLNPRKATIKLIIQEELTKLAEAEEDEDDEEWDKDAENVQAMKQNS